MTPERLRYAGRGLIVREGDGQLVSPRDVVKWFNELLARKKEEVDEEPRVVNVRALAQPEFDFG
jgi:hypothetical protein